MVPHATLPCTLMHHRQTLGEPDVDDTRLPCWELSRALIMSDGNPMDNTVHTCAYNESTNRVLVLLHRRDLTFDGGAVTTLVRCEASYSALHLVGTHVTELQPALPHVRINLWPGHSQGRPLFRRTFLVEEILPGTQR